jgi:hypothetical protein
MFSTHIYIFTPVLFELMVKVINKIFEIIHHNCTNIIRNYIFFIVTASLKLEVTFCDRRFRDELTGVF